MSNLNPNPQLGQSGDINELKRQIQKILTDAHAQVNRLSAGEIAGQTTAAIAAPTTGTHKQGDFVRNSSPAGSNPILGWVCTASGTPGTWVAVNSQGTGTGAGTVPLASAFTVIGAGITATDKTGRLQLALTTFTTAFRGVVKNLPATPYTIDVHAQLTGPATVAKSIFWGIALSDGTKYRTFDAGIQGGGTGFRLFGWATAAAIATNPYSLDYASPLYPDCHLRLTDNGTTRRYWISANGEDFAEVFNEATGTDLTPTQCGIHLWLDLGTAIDCKLAVRNFLVTNSVLGDAA